MKIPDIDPAVLRAAVEGDLARIDALLLAIQPGVYNLAVRMLGNRDDASDACQEILLKVVTHLAGYRGEAAFSTWVWQIARNHLLTAATRSRESPEVSLDAIAERLAAGLQFGANHAAAHVAAVALTPQDKLEARQIALGCTQGMLMALDREQRLAYMLDAVFGLSSQQAADVLGISAPAYRKRLSRARELLDPFFARTCGLTNPDAACRCERQLPAVRSLRHAPEAPRPVTLVALHRRERAEAELHFGAMLRMSDAAAAFRAHPSYQAAEAMIAAIRSVLRSEGYWRHDTPPPLQ